MYIKNVDIANYLYFAPRKKLISHNYVTGHDIIQYLYKFQAYYSIIFIFLSLKT